MHSFMDVKWQHNKPSNPGDVAIGPLMTIMCFTHECAVNCIKFSLFLNILFAGMAYVVCMQLIASY